LVYILDITNYYLLFFYLNFFPSLVFERTIYVHSYYCSRRTGFWHNFFKENLSNF
jgi:hypothetical protein